MSSGVLAGIRVIEVAGLGPGPFAAMLLSDMGADVIRVDRPTDPPPADYNDNEELALVNRGRSSVRLDLKSENGRASFLKMVQRADVLLEGFRPGVMERLGLGPEVCAERNPALVFARITGWGQEGPLAHTAGHDINYIALAGLLGLLADSGGRPPVPLNLLGDYAGGGLMAVIGILGALVERHRSGLGQEVDVSIVDGSALLMTFVYGQHHAGQWRPAGSNFLDGGAPYYNVYETADRRFVAFGAIEEPFFNEFLRLAGEDPADFSHRRDPEHWPEIRDKLAAIFRTRSQKEWTSILADSDACVTPILDLDETLSDAHLGARRALDTSHGIRQPQPAPRFSRTPSEIQGPPVQAGDGGDEALRRWGIDD